MSNDKNRIVSLSVEDRFVRRNAYAEQEQRVAIADLLDTNEFELIGREPGPYRMKLSTIGSRLIMEISQNGGAQLAHVLLSMRQLGQAIRDYVLICHSYYTQLETLDAYRLEAIDMSRRAIHDTGAKLLQESLAAEIRVDFETARRLFTVISVSSMAMVAKLRA